MAKSHKAAQSVVFMISDEIDMKEVLGECVHWGRNIRLGSDFELVSLSLRDRVAQKDQAYRFSPRYS